MLNVKNKRMNSLKEEIECSKGHLLYLIDVHIFSKVPAIHNTGRASLKENYDVAIDFL